MVLRPGAVLDAIRSAPPSKWFTAGSSLIPLLGVLAFEWELGLVMLAFWLENIAIGFYAVLRMAIRARAAAAFLVPFFLFHYGMFTIVHGIFVVGMFVQPDGFAGTQSFGLIATLWMYAPELGLVFASLMASHGASFLMNFVFPKAWTDGRPVQYPMGQAYKRVIALHLAIVLGAFPIQLLGSPVWGLVILVAAKALIDVVGHSVEHMGVPKFARPNAS